MLKTPEISSDFRASQDATGISPENRAIRKVEAFVCTSIVAPFFGYTG